MALVLLGGSACTSPDPSADHTPTLTDTTWQLQQIQYNNDTLLTPDDPERYTVEFSTDGQVAIQADCNRVLGTYTEDGSSLSITLGPTTLAACSPESIDGAFTQGLSNAAIYFFKAGDLYIDMWADAGTMQFAAAE